MHETIASKALKALPRTPAKAAAKPRLKAVPRPATPAPPQEAHPSVAAKGKKQGVGQGIVIRELREIVYQVPKDAVIRDVKALLQGENPISSIVVVDGLRPLGLVMSLHLDRTLSSQFGVALYHNKPVAQIMDRAPLVVEGHTPVEVVADQAMRREKSKVFDHIIVTSKGDLEGIVSVQVILQTLTSLQTGRAEEIATVNRRLKRATLKTESMNAALRTAYDRLQEVDKMKTDFLSMVSHELRTPLTSVLGFAEIAQAKLRDTIMPAIAPDSVAALKAGRAVEANMEIILQESERLTALVNDVLDIAKLEAGKIVWKKCPLEINDVIRRAIAATSALTHKKGLEMREELAEDLPQVHGDQDRLIQVVVNLISNALKFTEQGSVTCVTRLARGMVEILVRDTGIGIAAEDLGKVFDKFRQVGETLTQKPTGTGLGLPICKQIIESHLGSIGVRSTPGQGSEFHFTLPLARDIHAETPIINLGTLRQRFGPPETDPSGQPSDVLLVDHDPTIRLRLRARLEDRGFRVTEAVNESEVNQAVGKRRFSLIILRFMAPTSLEFSLAGNLARRKATRSVPIMMLTAHHHPDNEENVSMSLDRFLPNPVRGGDLLKEIAALSRLHGPAHTLLLAENAPKALRAMYRFLTLNNFRVLTASSHGDCLELAREYKPDIILAGALLSQRHDLVAKLRFETPMNSNFILLGGNSVPPNR